MSDKVSGVKVTGRPLITLENYDSSPGPVPLDPTGKDVPVCLQVIGRVVEDVMQKTYGMKFPLADPEGSATGQSSLLLSLEGNIEGDEKLLSVFLNHVSEALEMMENNLGENCPDIRLTLLDQDGNECSEDNIAPHQDVAHVLLAQNPDAFVVMLNALSWVGDYGWHQKQDKGTSIGYTLTDAQKKAAANILDENPDILCNLKPLYAGLEDLYADIQDNFSTAAQTPSHAPLLFSIDEMTRLIETDKEKLGLTSYPYKLQPIWPN